MDEGKHRSRRGWRRSKTVSAKKLPKVEEVEDYGISRGNLCQNCKPMPISVCVVVVLDQTPVANLD